MLDWLFGKKKSQGGPPPAADTSGAPPEVPDVVRFILAYWTYKPEEQTALSARGIETLPWSELFRLHHLNCLEVLNSGSVRRQLESDEIAVDGAEERNEALERCRQTAERLLTPESPYRPRQADVWQGALDPQGRAEPTMSGTLCNPSLTHLGCLEVLRLDDRQQPRELAFVPFDDLQTVAMAPPKMLRAARLFYEDGRSDEIVFLPLLYATSWLSSSPYLRDGRMTQFLAYPPGGGPASQFGIGVGQQDFSIRTGDQQSMFGLGSVAQIAFPLHVDDPRFALKCRARGLNPDEVLRRLGTQEG